MRIPDHSRSLLRLLAMLAAYWRGFSFGITSLLGQSRRDGRERECLALRDTAELITVSC
jgi:hypothetical protein